MKTTTHALALLALALACPAFAAGDDDQQHSAAARRHFELGQTAYNLQKFSKALEEFQAAYEERNDPAFLFNIAQAQRNLGQYESASRSYRVYLKNVPDLSSTKRHELERIIEKMDEAANDARAKEPPTGTQAPSTSPPQTTTPASPATHVPTPEAAPAPVKWYTSVPGWVLAGGGLAIGMVGVGFLINANSLDSQIATAPSLARIQQLQSDRDAYRISGGVLTAVGGAALVAGVVVFAVRAHHARQPVAASLWPSENGLMLGGTW